MPGMASPPTLSKRLLHLSALAVLASSLLGCRHSPLAARTSAFATAAATTAKNTDDAYDLVEQSFREAQIARIVAHYDEAGFSPDKLTPFLPETDRKVRAKVIDGLHSYAELLAAISGDQPLTDVDTGAKAMGASLKDLSANDLVSAHFTSTEASLAATAIDALGHTLIERKRRRELPSILHDMQQPIENICNLLASDIGDPEQSGLRNQLHNNYLNLIREQENYIRDNAAQLAPSEKRDAIRVLPALATSAADGDRALAATKKALLELARTHTLLAATASQKDAPAFRLQLQELRESAERLKNFYSSLPSHS